MKMRDRKPAVRVGVRDVRAASVGILIRDVRVRGGSIVRSDDYT